MFFLIFLAGLTGISSAADMKSCDVHHANAAQALVRGMSPYWAQEQIGADLAKELLEDAKKSYSAKAVYVADVDTGVNKKFAQVNLAGRAKTLTDQIGSNEENSDHGTKTLNIIAGRGRFGVGNAADVLITDIINVSRISADPEISAAYLKYVNFSQKYPGQKAEVILQKMKKQYPLEAQILTKERARQAAAKKTAVPETGPLVDGLPMDKWVTSVPQMTGRISSAHADLVSLEIHTLTALRSSKSDELNKALDQLSQRSIVVACAGNHHEEIGDAAERLLDNRQVIVVGSAHPYGMISSFSNSSKDVTVLAPADDILYSPGIKDNNFGGTSGAQPMVTGSLANAIVLLKPLNAAEAKILIKRTVTPLQAIEDHLNGNGLINSYKMMAYAVKLRQMGWPKNKEKLLADESLADFSGKAVEKLTSAKKILANGSCENREKALKLLRQSFLLKPSPEAADLISGIYKASQYPLDARFYDFYYSTAEERKKFIADWEKQPPSAQTDILNPDIIKRNQDYLDPQSVPGTQ